MSSSPVDKYTILSKDKKSTFVFSFIWLKPTSEYAARKELYISSMFDSITKIYTVSFFLAFILPSKSSKIKYTVESIPYIGMVLLGNFPKMLVLIYDSHNSWPFSKSAFIWPVSLSHAR